MNSEVTAKIISLQSLENLASRDVFQRGKIFFGNDTVSDVTYSSGSGNEIVAEGVVEGDDAYGVTLAWNSETGKITRYMCDCPCKFVDMCEHLVAFGLYIIKDFTGNVSGHMTHVPSSFVETTYNVQNIEVHSFMREGGFDFFLYNGNIQRYIKTFPEEWIDSLENDADKNFLAWLLDVGVPTKHRSWRIERMSDLAECMELLRDTTCVYDKHTQQALHFLDAPKPIATLCEYDSFDRQLSITHENVHIFETSKTSYWCYKRGEIWALPELMRKDIRLGIGRFFEDYIEKQKYGIALLGLENFKNRQGPRIEKILSTTIPFPKPPKVLESSEYNVVVSVAKYPQDPFRPVDYDFEITFFYEFHNKKIPIVYELSRCAEAALGQKNEECIFHADEKSFLPHIFTLCNCDTPLAYETHIAGGRFLLFLDEYQYEASAYVPFDVENHKRLLALLHSQKNTMEGKGNSLFFSFQNPGLVEFGNMLTDFSKNYGWEVNYEDGLTELNFVEKSVSFQVAVEKKLHGLLDFSVDFYLGKYEISKLQFEEMVAQIGAGYIETKNGFVKIENAEEIQKLFSFLQTKEKKHPSQKKLKYEMSLLESLELEILAKESHNYKIQRDAGHDVFVQECFDGLPIKNVSFSKALEKTLRGYQKHGVCWLHFLRKYHLGGILADDMGLGKTLQVIAYIDTLSVKEPCVVVCPKTLLFNWEEEIQKFAPHMGCLVVDGTKKNRREILSSNELDDYDIILTSYSLIKQDIEMWIKCGKLFDTVFLDEAQHIKNHKTKTTRSVKLLPCAHRIALTGTPIENTLAELWSIFDFLLPKFLGSFETFERTYLKPIMKDGNTKLLRSLSNKVKPLILRRTKQEMLSELPPKIEQVEYALLSKDQVQVYTKVLSEIKKDVYNTVEAKGFKKAHLTILAALSKLRQICNHPGHVFPEMAASESGKIQLCMELLKDAFQASRKVLIFSSFVKTLHVLSEKLDREGISYSYLDGQTHNRQKQVQEFNTSSDKNVFLISMKAGGTGLNLTSADMVILFDPWWNPMVEAQAADRAYRIGQKNTVNVYSLITKNTLEEKMLRIKKKKQELFNAVVGNAQSAVKKLSWDDVQELFE